MKSDPCAARGGSDLAGRSHHGAAGMVTAELAVVTLALVVVLAAVLSGVQWATNQSRAQDAASAASRQLARGDDPSQVSARVLAALPGANLQQSASAGYVYVTVSAPVRLLMGIPVTVSADAHVLVEQR